MQEIFFNKSKQDDYLYTNLEWDNSVIDPSISLSSIQLHSKSMKLSNKERANDSKQIKI